MFRSSVPAFYPLPRCLFYRVGRFHWSGFIIVFLRPPVRSVVKKVVHWMSEILFAAEIAFRRLDRGMPQQELNLLQLATAAVAQLREAVVDLIGKGGHIRTVPIPEWVKAALDQWTVAAGVTEGRIFRAVGRMGKVWGNGISQNVVWYVVRTCCERAGLEHIAPHDLRRTCAKLCHSSGGELEQ